MDAILITGVGKRVGLYLAQQFLDRDIPVIGTYRTERDSLNQLRDKGATLYQCDFNDNDQIAELISSIKNNHSSLRAIIHNASDWLPDNARLEPSTILQQMLQVHVQAPYQINLGLADLLAANKDAYTDIIHIGDYVSSCGSKKHIAYAASKAAQDNLTLSFAAKLAPKTKVNSIAPALLLFNEHDDELYRVKTLQKSLMQREAGLEEFMRSIDYLLNSQYVTGRILPLDGGRHLK